MGTNNLTTGLMIQIREDLKEYQEKYIDSCPNILKEEWAFNYWILDKLYSVDEDIIFDQITDYNDKGVDAWIFHEDSNDLYIIQNKFYSDNTPLSKDYVMNDFLVRAIGSLENGTYTRSSELQKQFTKHFDEKSFAVHFMLYVTNNNVNDEIINSVKEWNIKNKDKNYTAKIFSLNDIYEEYYGDLLVEQKNMKISISTINKSTTLNIDNFAYGLNQAIDAKYVMTPIYDVYKFVKKAKEIGYQIFDKNIREFLGTNGRVNKKIKQTLEDDKEKGNFFFYNNGITIICDDIKKTANNKIIEISNPQIVNGCQTVSTIYEVLDSLPSNTLEKNFENSYIMAKVLKMNTDTAEMQQLYDNIVKYNNSQNSIQDKQFVADRSEFYRLQKEFESRGFYLCIKQSDSYKFKKEAKLMNCLKIGKKYLDKFGISTPSSTKPFIIDLEKLLQVIVSFVSNSQDAVQRKSKLLQENSEQNKKVLEFIRNENVTTNTLLDLYCLYLRCEQEKGKEKNPNSFMLIDSFAKFECNDRNEKLISSVLEDKDKIDKVIKLYKAAIVAYYNNYKQSNPSKEYNDMIKEVINYQAIDSLRAGLISIL